MSKSTLNFDFNPTITRTKKERTLCSLDNYYWVYIIEQIEEWSYITWCTTYKLAMHTTKLYAYWPRADFSCSFFNCLHERINWPAHAQQECDMNSTYSICVADFSTFLNTRKIWMSSLPHD